MKINQITQHRKHNINFGTRIDMKKDFIERLFLNCKEEEIGDLYEAFERFRDDGINNMVIKSYENKEFEYPYDLIKGISLNFNNQMKCILGKSINESNAFKELASKIIQTSFKTTKIKNELIQQSLEENKKSYLKDKRKHYANMASENFDYYKPLASDTPKDIEKLQKEKLKKMAILNFRYSPYENQTKIHLDRNEISSLFDNSNIEPQKLYDAFQRILDSNQDVPVKLFYANLKNGKAKAGITFSLQDKWFHHYYYTIDTKENIENKIANARAELLIEYSKKLGSVRSDLIEYSRNN